jgi:GAF domain-containing protein
VKLWPTKTPAKISQVQFETQQQKLARLSGEVLERHRREIDREVEDSARLKVMYGSAFMSGGAKRQAQTVCLMATQMLNVPNSALTIVQPDRQEFIAQVRRGEILDEQASSAIGDSYCRQVIGTGREFAVEKSAEHPLVCDSSFARGGEIVSYLGVPVANRSAIIVGVLCVWDEVERSWTAADVSILTQLSLVLTRSAETVDA